MRRLWYFLPAIFWTVAIIVGSLLSGRSLKKFQLDALFQMDKIIHFVMYAGLSALLMFGFYKLEKTNKEMRRKALIVFLFSSTLGVGMEVLQNLLTSSRSFDYNDIIANIIGAFIGSAIFLLRNKQ